MIHDSSLVLAVLCHISTNILRYTFRRLNHKFSITTMGKKNKENKAEAETVLLDGAVKKVAAMHGTMGQQDSYGLIIDERDM